MASTREERLQMRQRGAGTRKIQQVDFGFSFGDQAGGLVDSAPPSLFPEPAKPPQEAPPTSSTPKASQSTSQTSSQSQRTPGSARNHLPQRPSAYDIPSDDGPQEPRSNKRRRINPLVEESGSPSIGNRVQVEHDNANATSNGEEIGDITLPDAPSQAQEPTIEAPEPQPVPEVPRDVEMREVSNGEVDGHNTPAEAIIPEQPDTLQPPAQDENAAQPPQESQPPIESANPAAQNKQRTSRSPRQAKNPSNKESVDIQADVSTGQRPDKDPAVAKEIQAPSGASKETKKRRGRPVNGDSSASQAAEESRADDEPRSKPSDPQASGSQGKADRRARARSEPEPEDQEPSNLRPGRRARKDNKTAEPESNTRAEQAAAEVDVQPEKESGTSRPSRGRPAKKDKRAEPESNTRLEQPEAETEVQLEEDTGPSKTIRGRPAKKNKKPAESESNTGAEQPVAEVDIEPEEVPAPPKSARGRPARKEKNNTSAEQPEPQLDPEAEPAPDSSKSHRAKDGRRKKRLRDSEIAAIPLGEQPDAESRPQREEHPGEEAQEPDASGPSQSRSNRRGKKSQKTVQSESTPTEETAENQPVRERRKPREPRGETVPVTVHRLANTSALGVMYTSEGSDDENDDSADELSTRQKTKLPKRGGVNPADVLGQICRETLEKTLTALKNGIENESNTQRRAEWTRKRKAVEAFGSELDGRLLDLSEMLDSNFVLGVQLKKEKRDMMDLRTHLYKVRQEREAIALQMDAVRAKHMEEEATKTSRTSINNSLHSLELALDRTQNRDPPSTDPSSAELEFMLRTVADDVSCRAPGSHGGLLEQIRTFNAQLESTARRLEGQ